MIAYFIHCHRRLDRVRRLLQWLYSPRDLYLVGVDVTGAECVDLGQLAGLPRNVVVRRLPPTVWGGASMLTATLEAMAAALAADRDWRWFVNLSGQDIPLKPQDAILSTLEGERRAGRTNFVATYGARPFAPTVAIDATVTETQMLQRHADVAFVLYGQARALFAADAQANFEPGQRASLFVSEDFARKQLHLRPLGRAERTMRARFFAATPFRFGRLWQVASRELCTYAVGDDAAYRLLGTLGTCFIPEESFFQMLVADAPADRVGTTVSDNLRYRRGAPHVLHDGLLPALRSDPALFARKLEFGRCAAIDRWIDEEIAPRR
ncbi:MAG: beta-1,6-N-acetylglucosaminyltransferase [Alphaproteobacteria bacterium]